MAALLGAATLRSVAGPVDPNPPKMKRPPSHFRPKVEVICISDQSLKVLGKWPFDRSLHAKLVDKLVRAGARTIGFDIYFGGRTSVAGDLAFARSIARSKRTWLIVNPTTIGDKDTEPAKPLAILSQAAGWRIAHNSIPEEMRFQGGVPLDPVGKSKIQHLCTGLMADYLGLRRWPYPTPNGDHLIVGSWYLPVSGGTFTSDGNDTRRLALDKDSWMRVHTYSRVLDPKYPMKYFNKAVVVIGLTAENYSEQLVFDDWNHPKWQYRHHVEAVGIFVEKMLRHLRRQPGE